MMRVADYIMQRVHEEGVDDIFFVTGGSSTYLTDAIARNDEINGIPVHHEQAGMMAALSYAYCNEKMGAMCVTTGCAGTNTMTGLLHAYQDSIPCIVLSGNAPLTATTRHLGIDIRQFGRQETDIVKIVEPITKYAVMIEEPKEIAYEMDKALYMAKSGRKGPVWVDVPQDIQNMMVNPDELVRYIPEEENYDIEDAEIDELVNDIGKAERPVLLIGNGVRAAKAIDEMKKFVEDTQIPVVYSRLANDIFPTDSDKVVGMMGSISGTRAGNFAVQNSDLLIVVGCKLCPDQTGFDFENFARAAKVVVVDIDGVEHSKNTVHIEKFINGDAKIFFNKINKREIKKTDKWWIEKCRHWKEIFPVCNEEHRKSEKINMFYLMECFSNVLESDAALVSDAGLTGQMVPLGIHFRDNQRSVHSYSQGEMGYSLPGSVGVYYARKTPVYAFMGDGSFMMNMQELETIAYNNLPIKIVILNNGGYVCVKVAQEAFFRGRTIGTDESNGVGFPKFENVANAFGLPYYKIENGKNLTEKLQKLIDMDGPVLCEIICTENQDYLHSTYGTNKKKRLVMRPIEDQFPFLDREVLKEEMVIDPIE